MMIGIWGKCIKIWNGYVTVCGSMKGTASRGMIGNDFGKKINVYILKTGERCINKKHSVYPCERHFCCE